MLIFLCRKKWVVPNKQHTIAESSMLKVMGAVSLHSVPQIGRRSEPRLGVACIWFHLSRLHSIIRRTILRGFHPFRKCRITLSSSHPLSFSVSESIRALQISKTYLCLVEDPHKNQFVLYLIVELIASTQSSRMKYDSNTTYRGRSCAVGLI